MKMKNAPKYGINPSRYRSALALSPCACAFVALLIASCSKGRNFAFMEKFLAANGLRGTVIVENLSGSERSARNRESDEDGAFLPASTFKIPNTLIALEEGAVKSADEVIPWDGENKGFKEWNKDQCVISALPSSCVWFYQELARRVGDETYRAWLERLDYGNGKTGPRLDTFWLDGDIRITPKQQISFLKKIYREEFPFKKSSYAVLKKALIVKETDSYVLRAKTGWTMRVKPQIGWYVGWLETKGEPWFFVVRIDIDEKEDARFREEAAIRALEGLGLME